MYLYLDMIVTLKHEIQYDLNKQQAFQNCSVNLRQSLSEIELSWNTFSATLTGRYLNTTSILDFFFFFEHSNGEQADYFKMNFVGSFSINRDSIQLLIYQFELILYVKKSGDASQKTSQSALSQTASTNRPKLKRAVSTFFNNMKMALEGDHFLPWLPWWGIGYSDSRQAFKPSQIA